MVTCLFEKHQLNKIIAVCFNPGCVQRRLVCFQCIFEHHQDHNSDLKQLSEAEQLKIVQGQVYDELQTHYNLVQQYLTSLGLLLNSIKTDVNQKLKNLNYKQLEIDIIKLTSFEKVKDQIQNTTKEISKLISSSLSNFTTIYKMQNKSYQATPNLSQQIQQTQLKIDFSQQYKNQDIIIDNVGKFATCNSSQIYNNQFIVCEPKIPQNGCFTFSFKIGGWVMIGICNKEKIQEQQYIAKFEQSYGHGCYFIENDGTLYSSLKMENNNQKGFCYTENEVIQVIIDMDKKLIKWMKPKHNQSVEMKIETSNDLYPCLGLGQAWVEII